MVAAERNPVPALRPLDNPQGGKSFAVMTGEKQIRGKQIPRFARDDRGKQIPRFARDDRPAGG
jgi:hypothetical protein